MTDYPGVEHWSERLRACEAAGRPYVLVTLLGARGSTPRESGTKMVVCADGCGGTIGGGQLEHRVTRRALALLAAGQTAQQLENFPLGEKLGQCCGGSVSVLFECFVTERLPVLLFGAGHVGRALAPLLASLPLSLRWIDSRGEQFPEAIPAGVEVQVTEDPLHELLSAPTGAAYIIMTHEHPLDFALTEAALRRGDASYIGLIGSESKWRRFALRLAHRGIEEARYAAVRCPIGLAAVPGKHPAEVAVSVAAELVAHYHAQRAEAGPMLSGWKDIGATLADSGALESLVTDDNA
jgi:xanthine dehydrogenase accessory factor